MRAVRRLPLTVWGQAAEAVTASIPKGTVVQVHGSVRQEPWTSKDGAASGVQLRVTVWEIRRVTGL